MEWIAAMQEAIGYMEEHLMEEINYEDVAKHVHTSSYEFHRAFSFLTGMTANAYIRNRRLSLAGREIVETDARISHLSTGMRHLRVLPKHSPDFMGLLPIWPEKSLPG